MAILSGIFGIGWRLPHSLPSLVLLAACPMAAWAQSPASSPATSDLVRSLAQGPFDQREEAAGELVLRGKEAIPFLLESIHRQELETSYRAVTILRDLCLSPDVDTWNSAQNALADVAKGDNRLAALFASDILRSQGASAELRLIRLGCKSINGRTTLTLPPTWSGGPDGLLNLRWLPQLRTIRVEGAKLSPESLAHLQYAKELQHLVIINAPVDDRVFEHIRNVLHLETLYLNGTKITDEGLKSLKGREKLTWLELQQTAISDASLVVLSSLKGLRGLQITGTKISARGVRELRKALPQTNIFHGSNGTE